MVALVIKGAAAMHLRAALALAQMMGSPYPCRHVDTRASPEQRRAEGMVEVYWAEDGAWGEVQGEGGGEGGL